MNIQFDHQRLLQLINSLYTLTGIRAAIVDPQGSIICMAGEASGFCQRINACPEGHSRCKNCDAQALKNGGSSREPYFYRCHAGVCEGLLPIYDGSTLLAYLLFGQHLDDSDPDKQWAETEKTLSWYPGDRRALKADFYRMQRYSREKIQAYAQILYALAAHIRVQGIIQRAAQTDQQRLEAYLDRHYTEKLSLETIAADLHMGRTKLCALAKQASGGSTLSTMITQRRIAAAKDLLLHSSAPISAVAEAVGISDYNYFTKVFRSATGMPPSAFRAAGRQEK